MVDLNDTLLRDSPFCPAERDWCWTERRDLLSTNFPGSCPLSYMYGTRFSPVNDMLISDLNTAISAVHAPGAVLLNQA